jgi:hypothetical protein
MQVPVRPVGNGSAGKSSPRHAPFLGAFGVRFREAWRAIRRPLPPSVRLLLLWLTPVLLLAAGLVALLSLLGGVELRTLEQHQYNASTFTATTSLIGQSFRAPRDNLSRIDVQLATRPNLAAPGEVRLLEGDGLAGRVLYSAPFRSANFSRDPFLSVEFPAISNSGGMTYTLVFQATDMPISGAFGVRYNTFDMISSGSMYADEGAQEGDLVISAYYRYGLADLLADIVSTFTGNLFALLAWVGLLFLPGLALLSCLPSGLTWGQSVLAAPGLTALALPVLLLVMRSAGLSLGGPGMWIVVVLSGAAFGWAIYRGVRAGRTGGQAQPGSTPVGQRASTLRGRLRLLPMDLLFWGLLGTLFMLTLAVRFLSLRDAPAGMGLDAYHHTLIARMILDSGGLPGDYQPYAPLSSFTYHYGFHSLVAGVAWLTGQTKPEDLLLLMPRVGQLGIALPVLSITLFAWQALGNRWAGLIAGTLAGLVCIFPAYYVNWSRYTQGLGLALLPVAWVLVLRIWDFGLRIDKSNGVGTIGGPSQSVAVDQKSEIRNLKSAIDRSGPYILGVIGVAGLFLTHYRIAMIFAVMFGLYVGARPFGGVIRRRGKPGVAAPAGEVSPLTALKRAGLLVLLTVAALSPWLLNLAGNFHSHLVGRDTESSRQYYDPGDMTGFINHPTIWVLYLLGAVGLMLAVRQRVWPLLLVSGAWALLGVWSNPYLLDWLAPGFRLPYSGYLDVKTWVQSLWLPLALLSGFALEAGARGVLSAGNSLSGVRARAWRTASRAASAVALLLVALAIGMPIAANVDGKPYVAAADREALTWMRDNLPRNANVLANPFAFGWARTNVYGSDAGTWIPLVSGVSTTVPPLPAYNERLADPTYLDRVLYLISYEPFNDEMTPENWQTLKNEGVTHIYVGSRGGALSVPVMLASDFTQLVFHKDGVYVFALR